MTNRSLLDRSVVVLLEDDALDDTPSRKDGISANVERLHRLQGTSLIFSASHLIDELSADSYATACCIFHRFFHQVSLKECDVWSVAMASTQLAAKMHEKQVSLRQILLAFSHQFRKRRLVLVKEQGDCERILEQPSIAASEMAPASFNDKLKKLKEVPAFSPTGPHFKEWHDTAVNAENRILRQLGFTLYWIPDHHPHKFLLHFLQILEIDNDKEFASAVWNYCNDICRLDLCVRFEADILACAAIYVAALEFNRVLPVKPEPWWHTFCGSNSDEALSTIANALLGLVVTSNTDVLIADEAFVRSLKPDGSFNDPDSFLWDSLGDC